MARLLSDECGHLLAGAGEPVSGVGDCANDRIHCAQMILGLDKKRQIGPDPGLLARGPLSAVAGTNPTRFPTAGMSGSSDLTVQCGPRRRFGHPERLRGTRTVPKGG